MRLSQIFGLFILLVLFGTAPCKAAKVKGIDLFGSDDLTVEQLIGAEPQLFAIFCEELEAGNRRN